MLSLNGVEKTYANTGKVVLKDINLQIQEGEFICITKQETFWKQPYLSDYDDVQKRQEILQELLGGMGKNVAIDTPFHCDYGKNIFPGDNVI